MKALVVVCVVMLVLCGSSVGAYTLTFDDIPSGTRFFNDVYFQRGDHIILDSSFDIADHSASSWGPPHSGSSVLVCDGTIYGNWVGFMLKGNVLENASSVGAYFSTEAGTVLQLIGYHEFIWNPVAIAIIGATNTSWNNQYVQISSPEGINMVEFLPVSADALRHFCLDDLTVIPVPEPSSLAVLGAGLLPLGFVLRRRRR